MLSDEIVNKLKKLQIKIGNDIYFCQDDTENFAVGDMVIDRDDGCYGKITTIFKNEAAVTSDGCTELGVPLSRLIKLKLAINLN